MDINSRIKWTPGMELSAKTFSALDDNFDLRQLISIRTTNGLRIGRLPGSEFSANGTFVRSSFEIQRLQCMALLASGMIVSIDERVAVPVAPPSETYTYLTAGFGSKVVEYEAHEQTFVRPNYSFQFKTLGEMDNNPKKNNDFVFPILRFKVSDGRIAVDPSYIAPCLILESDNRFMQFRDTILAKLDAIVNHKNMEDGEGKRSLLRYIFMIKGYGRNNSMEAFMQLMYETASTIKYFIMTKEGEDATPVSMWSQYDVERWMSWFSNYLDSATGVLDETVLEDHSIDFEALKAQLRKEIYEMMMPEMLERIKKVQQIINDDLHQKLSDALRDYIDGTFRKQLHDTLNVELTDELKQPLYDSLYEALYNALFVPMVEEEDNFMPLI